ncbi:MAG: YnfA family protein [Xanthomonadales bacterium]|nr:YnfA family protein [Xanthomonadales bacterium]
MTESLLRGFGLFAVTAIAELVGCWLPMLWLRKGAGAWVLLPAALALAAFVWLLSLHPAASGRVYAAYGGVYVATALAWLWLVDGIRPGPWDVAGVALILAGAAVITLAPRLQ